MDLSAALALPRTEAQKDLIVAWFERETPPYVPFQLVPGVSSKVPYFSRKTGKIKNMSPPSSDDENVPFPHEIKINQVSLSSSEDEIIPSPGDKRKRQKKKFTKKRATTREGSSSCKQGGDQSNSADGGVQQILPVKRKKITALT